MQKTGNLQQYLTVTMCEMITKTLHLGKDMGVTVLSM